MVVLIRADASVSIGTGHVMRCLALAQGLRRAGQCVKFCCAEIPPSLLGRLEAESFSVTLIDAGAGSSRDAELTTEIAKCHQVTWIVTDGYRFETDYQASLKRAGFCLICIDDINACRYVSDLVLNQNLGAGREQSYEAAISTRCLLGTQFALLREEYLLPGAYSRNFEPRGRRVLITMGGSDDTNMTMRALDALQYVSGPLEICVIVGACFPHGDSLEKAAKESVHKITVHRDVPSLLPFQTWCDVAIAAAGSTVWELAALKTPMILGATADNQMPIASELGRVSAAENVGWFEENSPDKLAIIVDGLLGDMYRRQSLGEQAGKLCDGRGVERVVSEMFQIQSAEIDSRENR